MKKLLSFGLSSAIALSMATPAFARTMENTRTPDLACMKTAVEKRETALIAAVDAFEASVDSAYATRKTALVAAWDITDKTTRQTTIRNAWKSFKTASQTAKRTWRDARKNSWKTFKTEAKACGGSAEADMSGEGTDATL